MRLAGQLVRAWKVPRRLDLSEGPGKGKEDTIIPGKVCFYDSEGSSGCLNSKSDRSGLGI